MNPGIYSDLTMGDYLAMPAVSASMIKTILDECPRAAWYQSWLNTRRQRFDNDATDRGTIAHGILLEGSIDNVAVIDPRDHPAEKTGAIPVGWTNKSIKAARDEARAAGKTPVLAGDFGVIENMVSAAWEFIHSLKETEPQVWAAFQPDGGQSEVTMVWQDGETLCRMRPDRISSDHRLIVDYKTSARSVEPDSWGRTQLVGLGYYLSAAWYRRGVKALTGIEPSYVFLAQEAEAPYLCSLVGVDPAAFALGAEKVAAGLDMWQQCVRTSSWPAYPNRVCYPEIPAWESARWMERQAREEEESIERFTRSVKAPSRLTAEELSGGIPL